MVIRAFTSRKRKKSGYILKEKLIYFERLKVTTGGDLGELMRDLKSKMKSVYLTEALGKEGPKRKIKNSQGDLMSIYL